MAKSQSKTSFAPQTLKGRRKGAQRRIDGLLGRQRVKGQVRFARILRKTNRHRREEETEEAVAKPQSLDTNFVAQSFKDERMRAQQRIDGLLGRQRIKGQAVGLMIMALLAAAIFWASRAQLEEVAVAEGMVIPSGNNVMIQHLEGGILEKVLIKEGDSVTVGQELFHLNLGTQSLDQERLSSELQGLLISRHRAKVEADFAETITFSAEHRASHPDIVAAEEQLFYSNRRVLRSSMEIYASQLVQKQSIISETKSQIASLERQLISQKNMHEILQKQLKSGVVSKVQLLEADVKMADIEGQIEGLNQHLPRITEEIAEIHVAREKEQEQFRIRSLFDLEEVESKIANIRKTLQRADEQQRRAVVISPEDGIVKSLRFQTVGNVVQPAQTLAELVPVNNELLIDARLKPMDIGFVREGQAATIKVETYDFSRYGGIVGEVALIGASSITTETGETYFQIKVRPEKGHVGENVGELPIGPGMLATVDIKTGSRTVLDFLLKPIIKIKNEAFRER